MSDLEKFETRRVTKHPLTNKIVEVIYIDEEGLPHRDGGPAIQTFSPTGLSLSSIYCQHGVETREDGPAIERTDLENGYHELIWKTDGLKSRCNGPAVIRTDIYSGVEFLAAFWRNGVRHRSDGYATTHRDRETGEITICHVYVDGVPKPSSQFDYLEPDR